MWPVSGEVITPYRNGDDPYAVGTAPGDRHRGAGGHAGRGGGRRRGALRGHGRLVRAHGQRAHERRRTTPPISTSRRSRCARARSVSAGERIGAVGTTGTRSAARRTSTSASATPERATPTATRCAFLPPPPATRAPAPARRAAPGPVGAPSRRRPRPPPCPRRDRSRRRSARPPARGAAPRASPAAPRPLAPRRRRDGTLAAARSPRTAPRRASLRRRTAPAPGRSRRARRGHDVHRWRIRSRRLPSSRHRADAAPRPDAEPAGPAPAAHGGPDLGWALACAGLLAAAGPRPDGRARPPERAGAALARAADGRVRRTRQRRAGSIDRRCRTTSRRRSTTSTASRIWATPTRRSRPTCSRGTCASAGRTSSSSPAPTSTASRSRRRPSGSASRRASSATATRCASRSSRPRLNVTNDFFIRTTDPEHKAKVAEVVQRIHDNGHVYAGTYEGWYCPRCADFKTEAELEDGNRCPIHKIELEREKEDNWFFRLSAFQEPLERLYAERPGFVTPQNRYNEALSFIKGGLRDVSLSRARLKWGVPVPWDESQVVYVWIDALLNYYTALSYAREGEDLTERFWPADRPPDRQGHPQVPRRHLAGAADGGRASRCRSGHDPRLPAARRAQDVQVARQRDRPVPGDRRLRADALRFYVLREVQLRPGRRGLARGLRDPLHDRARQRVRQPGEPHARDDRALPRRRRARAPSRRPSSPRSSTGLRRGGAARASTRSSSTAALDEIWRRVKRLNRFVQDEEPWKLAKDEAQASGSTRCSTGWPRACASCRVLLHPFMPDSAERLLAALGAGGPLARRAPSFGAVGGRRHGSASSASSSRGSRPRPRPPEAGAVVDTHCHLDSCEPPAAELVERARGPRASRGWRRSG